MKVRFALIGTGNIASTYANACKQVKDAEITAVISRSTDRAETFADRHGIGSASDSLGRIGDHIDAIMVATPNGLHHSPVIEAARMGKHSLVEKPLDISGEAMSRMISACDAAGVCLGCSYQRRTRADNQTIKRLLDTGAFGRVLGLELTVKTFRDQSYYDSALWRGTRTQDGGGPFMQQGSHDLDLLVWFFGLPKHVFARTGTFAHTDIEVEDHGAAILTFESGMIGTVTASTIIRPGFNPRLEIYTEKGTVVMENDAIVNWVVDGLENPASAPSAGGHSSASSAAVTDTSGHEAVIADFCQAINEGRSPLASGKDARRATDLILAIYESAGSGREMEIA